jgi:hypothetical protein
MAALSASSAVSRHVEIQSPDDDFSGVTQEVLDTWMTYHAAVAPPTPLAPAALPAHLPPAIAASLDPIKDAVDTYFPAVKFACTLGWNFGRNELPKVFGCRVSQVSKGDGANGAVYLGPFPSYTDEQTIKSPRYFADYKDKDSDQKRAPKELQAMAALSDDEAKAVLEAFLKQGPRTKDVYFPAWLLRCFMPSGARHAITTPEQVQALFSASASAKKSTKPRAVPKPASPPAVPKAAKPASAPKPASPIVSEDDEDDEEDDEELSLESSSSEDDDGSDDSLLVSGDDESLSSSSEVAASSKRRRSDVDDDDDDDDDDEPVHKRQRGDCRDFDRRQADHGEKTAIKSLKAVFRWNAARVRSLEATIAELKAAAEEAAAGTEAAVKAAVEEATKQLAIKHQEEETARKQKAAQFFAQMQGMF